MLLKGAYFTAVLSSYIIKSNEKIILRKAMDLSWIKKVLDYVAEKNT